MSGVVKSGEFGEASDHGLIDCRTGGFVSFADIEPLLETSRSHSKSSARSSRKSPATYRYSHDPS